MLTAPLRMRVEKDVVTYVHRTLRGKGQITVAVGQEVIPSEIIGSSQFSSGFRTLNLAQALSVAPKDVGKYLKLTVGQKIYKGELLAYKEGGFLTGKKIVTAPTDGVLDFLNVKTGEARLNFLPQKVDLPAAVYGIVEALDKARSDVVLRTQVSRIYGVFGTGKNRDGILHILSSRDDLIGASKISAKQAEQIVVGGSLVYKEAISAAISASINGIITGGINTRDFRGMAGGRLSFPRKLENDIGISIIVCEGFGSIPIGSDIYEILLKYNERFVFMDGNQATISLPSFESRCLTKVRNTKLPPFSQTPLIERRGEVEVVEIKVGDKVRVVGSSFVGEQGKIVAIDQSETLLPSGIRSFLLTLETKRRKVRIPSNNVEVI